MRRLGHSLVRILIPALILAVFVACAGSEDPTPTVMPTATAPPTQSVDDLAEDYAEIASQVDFTFYVPAMSEFHLADLSIGGTDEQPVVVAVYHLNGDDEQRLTIFQSGGLVNHGMSGEIETVEVWGEEAQFSHGADGLGVEIHDLSWDVEGRTFSISARGIDAETVLQFAESLEPYEASTG